MVVRQRHQHTYADYLDHDDDSRGKHEYLDGEIYAMAGGSPAHARIALNISALLHAGLAGAPCAAFSSDLRIRVLSTGLATYPDVVVICGQLELDPEDRKGHTATNPILLVEVLSPTTEKYDRGEKLDTYKSIPALREVMLVAHDRPEIEVVRREADGSWSRHVVGAGETTRLMSVGCNLPVDDVYRDPLQRAATA
jgi:Uma2 family endonuclease